MGAEKVNESLVKYLAGLMDADGSLSFTFKPFESWYYVGLTLGLASSDAVDKRGFVETLPALTGFGQTYRHGANNQFITWRISKRADLEMLLPRLLKHMVIKPKHWQWMLDEWRRRRSDSECSAEERDELMKASKESRRTNHGPLKPKNHPTWAWVAGYLDGDGWYSHYSGVSNGYTQWTICMGAGAHVNDAAVLDFLQRAFGGTVRPQGSAETVMVWKRALGYQHRSFALRFLPNVAKHSRLKRDKIDAIIAHHRQRLSVPGSERRFCEIEGCDRPRWGHGLCSMHYQRKRKADAKAREG